MSDVTPKFTPTLSPKPKREWVTLTPAETSIVEGGRRTVWAA